MVVSGNVCDNDSPHYQHFYAPDVGSQWIFIRGNVEWNAPAVGRAYSTSSHWPKAPIVYTWTSGNWFADPDDTPHSPGLGKNHSLPANPEANDLPLAVLRHAGLTGKYRALERKLPPSIYYSKGSGATVFVAGKGLTDGTVLIVNGTPVHLQAISPSFGIARVPKPIQGAVAAVTVK